ncbi:hypothetical protein [Haloplasma contractile]|uniref:Uncharacterized protein n=1 Tax=Haloplasma contractile SSD-17B TaxID=1033810 RepID=F7PWG1_9MOLU|nr:hypothetical protein [Haloplasma contractile]ERJ11881.1 hypothetical protein HLPCO_002121 [Haloplasma contractile SSD-17B]
MTIQKLEIKKSFIIKSIILNLLQALTFFNCTLFGALVYLLFFRQSNPMVIMIIIAVLLITSKTVVIYKIIKPIIVHDSPLKDRKVLLKSLSVYLFDIMGLLLIFFVVETIYMPLIIVALWVLYAVINGVRIYKTMQGPRMQEIISNINAQESDESLNIE